MAGSGLVRIAAMVASFLVGVLLARSLGLEGYGYYGLALGIITIAGIPAEMGLPKLVTREVATAVARDDRPALFGVLRWADLTCIRISALMVVAVVAAALILLETRPTLASALFAGAPVIPLLALARIRGGTLQGLHFLVRGQIPATLLRQCFFAAMLAATLLAGFQTTAASAMVMYSATAAAVLLIAHLWLRSRLPKRSGPVQPVSNGRGWLASTVPLAAGDGIRVLQVEITVVLLGLMAAPADVGLFRIAIVTATIAAAPLMVLVMATMPVIARLYSQNQIGQLQTLLRFSAYAQTAGVVLLSLPLLLFPELLLTLVFGEDFAGAANALRIVSLGQIANAAFGLNAPLLNMTYNEARVTRAMGIGLVLNVLVVLLFSSIWGVTGAAAGFALSMLSWNILTWLDGRRILGLETSIMPLSPKARPC